MSTPLKAPPPPEIDFDFALPFAPKFRVNAERGSLDGLAILTAGREALGHGIYIDQRTVDTGGAVVAERGGRMRGAITHGGLIAMLKNGGDRIMEIPGYFSDVKVVGTQLVGDFQFFDTFRAEQPQAFARLMEMAAKTPDLLGLSAEPTGYLVFVAEDGTEYTATFDRATRKVSGAPDGVAMKYQGMPAMRITRLRVAAFVDEPAANDGLFAKLSRLFGGKQTDLESLRLIAESFLKFAAKNPPVTNPADNDSPENPTLSSTNPPNEMITFAAIKEKFGSAKDKLARALHLAAEDPTRTLEQVESALAAESASPPPATEDSTFTAIVAHFGADKATLARALNHFAADSKLTLAAIVAKLSAEDAAEVVELRKNLAAEKKRAETAIANLTAIKNSGHHAALNLSAGNGESGAPAKKELFGINRMAAAFRADPKNPANAQN